MQLTKLPAYLVTCLALTSTLGCGDDDDGDGGGGSGRTAAVDSGVDDSKALSSLTDAEVQQLSQGFASAAQSSEFIDAICKMSGVFSSAFLGGAGADPSAAPTDEQKQMCNQMYDQCKTAAAQNPAATDLSNAGTYTLPASATGLAGCNVTVGELEACWTEQLKLISDIFGSLSCDAPGQLNLEATATPPAACTNFATQCSAAVAP